jgi:hypothetical protein
VEEATPYWLGVRWPWRHGHQVSGQDWDGRVGFDFKEWYVTPFRVDPDPTSLSPGDQCRIGIPPTVVHVLEVDCWVPDREMGWLPGQSVGLTLLSPGMAHRLSNRDQASDLSPYGPEPIRVELLLRPYAFLEDLDVVTDRDGRGWEFCRPYWWAELDRDDEREGPPSALAGPRWPLTLLHRRGRVEPTPAEAKEVVRATLTGSHGVEVARWSRLAGVEPVDPLEEGTASRVSDVDPWVVEAEVMRVREELAARRFSAIVRAYLQARVEHRQIALAGHEFDRVPDLKRLEVRLREIATIVRELRSQGAVVLER